MLTFFNKRLHNKKGFTLIELIVVIAILGILIAIAVPRLGGFTGTAETRAEESNIRVLEGASAMYHAEYGEWPDNINDLSGYVEDDFELSGFDIGSTDGSIVTTN